MPWFRIDDRFSTHPKVLRAGNAAIGLFTRLGSYSAQHLTDGVIPASIVRSFGTRAEANALLREGMLERDGDDYRIRDYLDWNPSADHLRAERNAARDRLQRWRQQRNGNAVSNGDETPCETQPHTHTHKELLKDVQQPPYVQPVPTPVDNLARLPWPKGGS